MLPNPAQPTTLSLGQVQYAHSEADHKNTVCVASRKDKRLLGVGGHFLKYPTFNCLRRSRPRLELVPDIPQVEQQEYYFM